MNSRALALTTAAALAATTLAAATPSATAARPATPASSTTTTTAPAAAPAARPWIAPGAVVTDGYVDDTVLHDGDVVLRGRFSRVGRYSGPTVLLDAATGVRADAPVMDGEISVSTPDGAGGWYVGGYFSKVDAARRQNLLHVEADGSLDPQFKVPVTGFGGVYALQLVGTTLYLAGWFDHVAGAPRRNLAAVSTTTNTVTSFRHNVPDPVSEIAYAPASGPRDARLYASADGDLLALDAATGEPAAGFDAAVASRTKFEIAVDGDHVYVGGRGVVALDADDGSVDPTFAAGGLQPAPENRPDDAVSTLLVHNGLLYVGGDFTELNGATGPLAALDLTTGTPDPLFTPDVGDLGPATDNRGVFDVTASGAGLWVGGRFGTVGGTRAHNLALVDAVTGTRTPVTVPVPAGPVNAVDVSDGQVLVGGDFSMVDATRALGTAVLDGTTLEPISGATVRSRPYGALVDGGPVVYSVRTYGIGRSILAFAPATGAVDEARSHELPGAALAAATATADRLYTVQSSKSYDEFGALTLSVFDNATGRRVQRYRLPYPGYVTDVRYQGGDLLVAGSFRRTRPVSEKRANLAVMRVNLRTGRVVQRFDPHLNGPVADLTPAGSPLVVTGLFNRSNPRRPSQSHVHRGIARLDAQTGITSNSFQGTVANGHDTVLEPYSDAIVMYHPTYTIRARYMRFSDGAKVADPTGGYGRFVTDFFPLGGGGTGFLGDTGYYDLQYVAAVPD